MSDQALSARGVWQRQVGRPRSEKEWQQSEGEGKWRAQGEWWNEDSREGGRERLNGTRSLGPLTTADGLAGSLQVDIGLLDVRFRGKTLRVEIGSCSFQWEKGRTSRAAYDRITRGSPPAPVESVLCTSRGAVQETRAVDSCKRSCTVADLTELPSPSQGQRLSLHGRANQDSGTALGSCKIVEALDALCPQLGHFRQRRVCSRASVNQARANQRVCFQSDLCAAASHRPDLPHFRVSTRKFAKHRLSPSRPRRPTGFRGPLP